MRFTIKFDEQKQYFLVTTFGPMTIKGEGDMVMQLTSHPRWHEKHNLIVDHRLTDTSALSDTDITTLSVLFKMFAEHIGDIKTAIVVSDATDIQRVEIWQQQISNLAKFESHICKDIEAAEAWLN